MARGRDRSDALEQGRRSKRPAGNQWIEGADAAQTARRSGSTTIGNVGGP